MQMRDDYILRIIKFLGDFLSSIISGKKWDKKDLETIANEKIGLPYKTVMTLDASALSGILKTNMDTWAAKVYLSAALLVHEASKNETGAAANYEKALTLLGLLESIQDLSFAGDVKKLIQFIKGKR